MAIDRPEQGDLLDCTIREFIRDGQWIGFGDDGSDKEEVTDVTPIILVQFRSVNFWMLFGVCRTLDTSFGIFGIYLGTFRNLLKVLRASVLISFYRHGLTQTNALRVMGGVSGIQATSSDRWRFESMDYHIVTEGLSTLSVVFLVCY